MFFIMQVSEESVVAQCMVSTLASEARGPSLDPHWLRGKFRCLNTLSSGFILGRGISPIF